MRQVIVVMAMLTVVLPACKSMPWQQTSNPSVAQMGSVDTKTPYEAPIVPEPGLPLSTEQRFKDIPLPTGLKEDIERTFVYESASLQVGRMVYTSRASLNDLTQFFLKQCPTADWKLQNVLEAEAKTLLFTKPGKRLEIAVQNLGVAKGRRVILTLKPDPGAGS
jgi:hypothetical protein